MKQKPFNDNLVMASIESLYEQASHTFRPKTTGLRRHNPNNLPIIGSLPVQIGQQEESSELDDIVLTGRLHAAFADGIRPNIVGETDSDQEQGHNPFLEIRQAVIAAGNNNKYERGRPGPAAQAEADPVTASINAALSAQPSELADQSTEQTFAKELANLIDAEIERRLAVRTHIIKNPSDKNKSPTQTSPKQQKPLKKLKKTKEKAARKPGAKKPSSAKRIKPR